MLSLAMSSVLPIVIALRMNSKATASPVSAGRYSAWHGRKLDHHGEGRLAIVCSPRWNYLKAETSNSRLLLRDAVCFASRTNGLRR
jgi:hypothetical protein